MNTKELTQNIVAQCESKIGQSVPFMPKAAIRVIAKALAGVLVSLYRFADWMTLQLFPSTASASQVSLLGVKVTPLNVHGVRLGAGEPRAATATQLLVDVNVTAIGSTLPSGTQLVSTRNGVTYITTQSYTLSTNPYQINIKAVNDQAGGYGLGEIGNLTAGNVVSFVNPLAGVSRDTTVASQSVTGADAETTAAYRQRVVDRSQRPPQGGAPADYRAWATEIAFVVRAFPYRGVTPGTVDLYVETTSSGGVATDPQLIQVQDYVNDGTRRPVTASVNVKSIARTTFSVVVQGLQVNDETTTKAAIVSALTSYFLSREPLITALSTNPRKDRITQSSVAGTVEDVVTANGGIFEQVVITQSGITIGFYSLNAGELAELGALTYA